MINCDLNAILGDVCAYFSSWNLGSDAVMVKENFVSSQVKKARGAEGMTLL